MLLRPDPSAFGMDAVCPNAEQVRGNTEEVIRGAVEVIPGAGGVIRGAVQVIPDTVQVLENTGGSFECIRVAQDGAAEASNPSPSLRISRPADPRYNDTVLGEDVYNLFDYALYYVNVR